MTESQPLGFYWSGNDPKLKLFWDKVTKNWTFPGYVPSKTKPNIFVKQQVQSLLDAMSL